MPDPPILVGLRLGEEYRNRNWRFSRRFWEEVLGWPIVEGHYDDPGAFSLARASNRAAALAGDWEVALYVGADFFIDDPKQAYAAIQLAQETEKLVLAHDTLIQLDERETGMLMAAQTQYGSRALIPGGATGHLAPGGQRHPNTFSGVLAFTRSLWDLVGGFDARFVGWGYDDIAFWCACSALAGYERVPGTIYHLWHPRTRADNEESPEFPRNQVLGNRYLAAKNDPAAMRGILAEWGD